jgi:hypothetical protein
VNTVIESSGFINGTKYISEKGLLLGVKYPTLLNLALKYFKKKLYSQ